jgi:hypothetical protein
MKILCVNVYCAHISIFNLFNLVFIYNYYHHCGRSLLLCVCFLGI